MKGRRFLTFLFLIAGLCALCLAVSQTWAQTTQNTGSANGVAKGRPFPMPGYQGALHDAQTTSAAFRKAQGMMQYTTNDDRWAAAIRASNDRAQAIRKGGQK